MDTEIFFKWWYSTVYEIDQKVDVIMRSVSEVQ